MAIWRNADTAVMKFYSAVVGHGWTLDDGMIIRLWYNQQHSHSLTDHSECLYNIGNGQVASAEDVSVHESTQIGQDMQKRLSEI